MARSVLHINIVSFFASVEKKERKGISTSPVIVTRPRGRLLSEVACASREAHACGVRHGMGLRKAQRACPNAIIIEADYALYRKYFEDFLAVVYDFTPQVEPTHLSGLYADVTASQNLFGSAPKIAKSISIRAYDELGLQLHIGCADNKLAARAASSLQKPFIRVHNGREREFLATFPVSLIDCATGGIQKRLRELQVNTLGALSQICEELLVRQFGETGLLLKRQSCGIDSAPVKYAWPPETVSSDRTFDSPIEEPAGLEEAIKSVAAEALRALRAKNMLAGEIATLIFDESETPPGALPAYLTFKQPTDSSYIVSRYISKIVERNMSCGMQIYRINVTLGKLTGENGGQLSLFGEVDTKDRLERTFRLVAERFGDAAITSAAQIT